MEVYKEQRYVQWAQRWLRGTGRKATTSIQKIIYAAYYDDTRGSPAAAMAAYHAAMAAYSIAKCAVVPLITMSNASKAAGHAADAAEVDGPVIDFAALAHRAIAAENEQPSA